MKLLTLTNPSYRYLEQSFKEWLDVLGYAPISVYNMPLQVRELLLYYLESQNISHIKALESKAHQGTLQQTERTEQCTERWRA